MNKELKEAVEEKAEQLHSWYLEAITSGVAGNQYNPNAIKEYKDLSEEQKAIDRYIALKIIEGLPSEWEMLGSLVKHTVEVCKKCKQRFEESACAVWRARDKCPLSKITNEERVKIIHKRMMGGK